MSVAGGGTGPAYAASVVLMLNRAQLKDGGDKVGIIVTAKPDKNRFARPHPIKFHLHFTEGMNKYVGLEQYVSWDVCGIARGTIEKGVKTLRDSARTWICEHLDHVVNNKDFFTEEVFTRDVLEKINKEVYPLFNYNVDSTDEVLEDILSEDE